MTEMLACDVADLVRQWRAGEMTVWLDGGWGVDALLGEPSRPHHDLDIVLKHRTLPQFAESMVEQGFHRTPMMARSPMCSPTLAVAGSTSGWWTPAAWTAPMLAPRCTRATAWHTRSAPSTDEEPSAARPSCAVPPTIKYGPGWGASSRNSTTMPVATFWPCTSVAAPHCRPVIRTELSRRRCKRSRPGERGGDRRRTLAAGWCS